MNNEAFNLPALLAHLALLSLMAVGGIVSVAPDMHRYLVEAQGWLSSEQFAAAYALGQAAPGPNLLFVSFIGWQLAGAGGALTATLAVMLPSSLLALAVSRFNDRIQESRAGRAFRAGMGPVVAGLVLAAGVILLRSAESAWGSYGLTAMTALAVLRTRLNPLWLIAGGALAGAAGWM